MDLEAFREHLLELEHLGRESARDPSIRPARHGAGRAVLELAGETVSAPVERIEAVLRTPEVLAVPGAAAGVLGAVCHGMRVLAVVDPAPLAGTATDRPRGLDTMVVLRLGTGTVAVPVDAVHGLADGATAAARELDLEAFATRLGPSG